LWLDGENLRSLPLIDCKHRLHELIQKSDCPRIIYAQHIEGQGVGFFQEICQRDLEGIVCKRMGGIYKSNGTGWLKVKNPKYSQAEGRGDLFKRDTGHSDDTRSTLTSVVLCAPIAKQR
jgi:ATP-dependent DNA ligase